jgi:hypothetical protein
MNKRFNEHAPRKERSAFGAINEAGYEQESPRRLLGSRALEFVERLRPLGAIKPAILGQYLVKGWIDRGTLSVVYGESNVGKTFLALDVAFHVAAGIDWHGARVASADKTAGGALYIAGEGGRGINNRIEALRHERGDLMTLAEARGYFALLPVCLDLCGDGDGAALVEMLQSLLEKPPALIVVDTLARAIGGGDENSGQDMGALIRNVDAIREATGAHVMLIHHSGKDTTRGARGHSSLRAAADTEIELRRSGDMVEAETKKQRDIGDAGRFAYTLQSITIGMDEDGDEVSSAVVEPTDVVARKPRITGQALVALQALDDAVSQHGEKKVGALFPANRQCVNLERWREFCDRRELSSGESDSAKRKAFFTAKTTLQNKGFVCIQDGFAWRVGE